MKVTYREVRVRACPSVFNSYAKALGYKEGNVLFITEKGLQRLKKKVISIPVKELRDLPTIMLTATESMSIQKLRWYIFHRIVLWALIAKDDVFYLNKNNTPLMETDYGDLSYDEVIKETLKLGRRYAPKKFA